MSKRLPEEITVLKPGKFGFGVMIEQDAGYIDPNHENNKNL